ncbi:hypothetical protein C5C74_13700 [Rathayibacter sp. AY1E8]|uniref:DUF2510 domain-containing protein n=1 Tax=unclassified Rathayibacter TaxID=2609250 RepID=UPI000CE71F51|nr:MULTISPECIES: DUF2510 domain-containing protein [unclassified Rathayibacter]PPG14547.1 hypothetical protein C5C74_13700 [Rathayibacter sp. AY1E8]PPG15314.1 hypothetical protein C5D36_09425 [Rathayibacter sp. AY1C6]
MPHETPAGWYPAPHANNEQRYWDGQRWHDDAPPPPPAQPGGYGSFQQTQPTAASWGASAAPKPKGPAAFAILALVLGILAFLTGLVPGLGLVLAIAAVALAVLALLRKQPKGLAVTGLALGAVALISGIFATTLSLVPSDTRSSETAAVEPADPAPAAAAPESEAAEAPAEQAEAPAEDAVEPEPAPEQTEAAAPTADGSAQQPLPQPYVAEGLFGGDKYSLTAKVVDANAGALVTEGNMFNDEAPAGFKYVVVELTMTGIDPDGVEPSLASFDLSLATPEGNRYDNEYVILGDSMPSMSDGPTLYPGTSFTGYTAYVVPESAQSFLLHDNGNYIAL